jgi:glycogen operon protein
VEFVRRLLTLRREHPVFRRARFLEGRGWNGSGLPDVWWFRPDGRRMTIRDWDAGGSHVGVFLNGSEIAERTRDGQRIVDDSFLLLFNAGHDDVDFQLPSRRYGSHWVYELCTADAELGPQSPPLGARERLLLTARSMQVLRRAP